MPFYYLVTTALPVETSARTAYGSFDNTKMSPQHYTYKELIECINRDRNFNVYATLDYARVQARKRTYTNRGNIPEELSSYAREAPLKVGAELLMGKLYGASRVAKQSLVLKIFSFAALPDDTEIIPQLTFTDTSRISTDQQFYLDSIRFQKQVWRYRPAYPDTYRQLLNKSVSNIIADYHKPVGGLFLTGHWNRHHLQFAQHLVTEIDKHPELTLELLLDARRKLLSNDCNQAGSFFKRLNCAIEYTIKNTEKNQPAPAQQSTSCLSL